MGCWGAQVDPDFLAPLAKMLEKHVSGVVATLTEQHVQCPRGVAATPENKRRVAETTGDRQPVPAVTATLTPPELWQVLKNDEHRMLLHKQCMHLSKCNREALEAGETPDLTAAEREGLLWPFTIQHPTKVPLTKSIYRPGGTENKKEVKRRVAEATGDYQPAPAGMETLTPPELWQVLKNDGRRMLLHKQCMPLSKRSMEALEAGETPDLTDAECDGLWWPFTIRYPAEVPLTDKDGIKTDTETLAECADEVLQLRAEVSGDKKLLETYVPLLSAGTKFPINPRWNVLVDSGRTSCGKPNLQNQPRQPGVRECFVPHEGCVFVACDYAVAELRSLAQVLLRLFGWSKMADAVKEGKDLHLVFVGMLLGISYEEVYKRHKAKDPLVKKMRNLAKAMNFGVPGGLGAEKFVKFAKASYGIHIAEYAPDEFWTVPRPDDLSEVDNAVLLEIGMAYFKQVLKPLWLDTYPEMRLYFQHIGSLCAGEDAATVTHPLTGYIRGGVFYCAACNQNFQHLTAMGAKKALYEVARECYVDSGTDLFGCRLFAFIHDEIIIEAPEWLAEKAAKRLEVVMADAMKVYTPDVPVGTDSGIMRRWRKGAEGSGIWEDRVLTDKEVSAIKEAEDVWTACIVGGVEPGRAMEIRG
jgi:DNA polymerase-1